jgi:hypothetical protein
MKFPPRFTGRQTSTWTVEIATRLIAGAGDLRLHDQLEMVVRRNLQAKN